MKRVINILLTAIMILSVFAGPMPCAYAADETVFTAAALSDGEQPEPKDAFAEYVDRAFSKKKRKKDTRDISALPNLSGTELYLYNVLAAYASQVADGELASTVFEVSVGELGLDGKYTAADLGVDSLIESGDVSPAAIQAMSELIMLDYTAVIYQLLCACPYDLYWFDKTAGVSWNIPGIGFESNSEYPDGYMYFVGSLVAYFSVAQEYAGAGEYTVNTSIGQTVQAAADTAKAIVKECASLSDYEKVRAYKDIICELVDYNYDAAEDESVPYGNPWQLIWVFDDDDSTSVVCEGYSKAFQYLCNLSEFADAGVDCISVCGNMYGGTGSGPHMWNILTMNDRRNYLVDVTNCDDGAIGDPDLLFLKAAEGSVYSGYTANCYGVDITYVYDYDMLDIYGEGTLTLSDTDYNSTNGGEDPGNNGLTAYPKDHQYTVTAEYGSPVELEVIATVNEGSVYYQWYEVDPSQASRDKLIIIEGATNSKLRTDDVFADSKYQCHVTDDYDNEVNVEISVEVDNSTMYATYVGISLSLQGDLSMNFYIDGRSDWTVDIDYDKETAEQKTVKLKDCSYSSGNKAYKIVFTGIAAKEMTDKVTLTVRDENGTQLRILRKKTGEFMPGSIVDYSVATWANNKLADPTTREEEIALAQAILNYGQAAQENFADDAHPYGYNLPDKPANPEGYLAAEMAKAPASFINTAYDKVVPDNAKELVKYKGATLLLKGALTVRLYFTEPVNAKLKTVDKETGEVKYTTLSVGHNSTGYYIEKLSVPSKDLDEMWTFVIEKDGKTCTIQYGALSWCNSKLADPKTSIGEVNICKALYLYNKAANAYF